MKILHVITTLSAGGAERALFNLLQGGLAQKADNAVISLRDIGAFGRRIRDLLVPVYTLDLHTVGGKATSLVRLANLGRQFKPDVIHGWMYHSCAAAFFVKSVLPTDAKLVWAIRQSLYDTGTEKSMTRQVVRLCRALSKRADRITYNSKLSLQQHSDFGFSEQCAEVIPNGIDTDAFQFNEVSRRKFREEHGIASNGFVIGNVSRHHPMKDHETFVRAADELVRTLPNVHVVLCGAGIPAFGEMRAHGMSAAVRKKILFLDEVEDVAALMSGFDVFCQSSWSESFPNVLGEAMSVGVPCIATDVGDSARILGDTGLLISPRSADEIVKAVSTIRSIGSSGYSAMSENARTRITSNFALSTFCDRYETLYRQISNLRQEDV